MLAYILYVVNGHDMLSYEILQSYKAAAGLRILHIHDKITITVMKGAGRTQVTDEGFFDSAVKRPAGFLKRELLPSLHEPLDNKKSPARKLVIF